MEMTNQACELGFRSSGPKIRWLTRQGTELDRLLGWVTRAQDDAHPPQRSSACTGGVIGAVGAARDTNDIQPSD